MTDRCAIAGCRAETDLTYLGHGVCSHHWNEMTAESAAPDVLRMALRIEASASTATEVDMSETKKSEPKHAKKSKTTKQPRPEMEKAPKDATRVFAIRVSDQELEAIHQAAGPRNATRMIRAVAAAFASEDEAAFKAVLKEAKEARQ